MGSDGILSDHDHPLVIETAAALSRGKEADDQLLEALFCFVRDRIMFGFPKTVAQWDRVKASSVIQCGFGYCNTKATLLVALCRASGIRARVHYGLISTEIMRGIFPSFAFPFLGDSGSHSWTEVEIAGEWKPIDSYINDEELYRAARRRLEETGTSLGCSVACLEGICSCEFNFGELGFVHMGAVVEDHGVWDDASHYYATDKYSTFKGLQRLFYPVVAAISNRNIEKLRTSVRGAT
jgi:hypothetical protein